MDRLKEKSRPFDYNNSNYNIYYSHNRKQLMNAMISYNQRKELYFDEEIAEQLINDYPKELKHWYLEMPYED